MPPIQPNAAGQTPVIAVNQPHTTGTRVETGGGNQSFWTNGYYGAQEIIKALSSSFVTPDVSAPTPPPDMAPAIISAGMSYF